MSKNILIISLQGLGNTALFDRILTELAQDKSLSISMVVSNNGSYQLLEALHPRMTFFIWDELRGTLSNILRLTVDLRKRMYNLAYATYPSAKRENMLLFLSRAKIKKALRCPVGFFSLFQFLHPFSNVADEAGHDVENNAMLFSVQSVEMQQRDIAQLCQRDSRAIRVGFNLGSKSPTKRWDVTKWIALIDGLAHRHVGLKSFIYLGSNEKDLLPSLKSLCGSNVAVLINENMPSLITSIRELNLMITHDSGIGHIAALMNIPTVALWPYTSHTRVSPYGNNNVVIRKNFDCMPCYSMLDSYLKKCPHAFRCITSLSVDEVFLIVSNMIDRVIFGQLSTSFDRIDCVEKVETLRSGCEVVTLRNTV